MPNVLTALAPTLFAAAQITPRELTGFTGAAKMDFDAKGVAIGDTVSVPVVPQGTAGDYTPAMSTTAGSSTTPSAVGITISKNREYTFFLTGEQERSLSNGGDNIKEFMRQSTEQGIRTLVNEIEADLGDEAHKKSSRAVGTAGTTPFASDIKPVATVLKVLLDNGIANAGELSMVLNTDAGLNLRNLVTINNNPAGSKADEILAGVLTNLHGIKIRESAQVKAHTKGTGASYLVNNGSGIAINGTDIAVDTGSGTVVAGDSISISGSLNYIVGTALSGSTLAINLPGLRAAWADNAAITVGNSYAANMLIHKQCLVAAVRPPIIPASPSIEQMAITDSVTGLTFLFCRIVGDGMVTYRLNLAWGVKGVQPQGIATLMG